MRGYDYPGRRAYTQDAVALSAYLAGRVGRDERSRALLDAENRLRRWILAMGLNAETEHLLYGHGLLQWCYRERHALRLPRVVWTGETELSHADRATSSAAR